MTVGYTLPQPQPQAAIANALLPFGCALGAAMFLAPISMTMAAAIYVIAFTLLAWQRHDLALMVMLVSAFSQHTLPLPLPVHVSLGEANLALLLTVMCVKASMNQLTFRMSPVLWPIAFYLLVGVVASLLTWRGATALTSTAQMMVYLVVAVIVGASVLDEGRHARPALYGLAIASVPIAVVLMLSDTQYVLGLHKNGVGAGLAVGLIVATELLYLSWDNPRQRRLLLLACMIIGVGLIFSLSRGAWLSAAAGIALVLLMRKQYALTLRLAVLVSPAVLIAWFSLPAEMQEYAFGFEAERRNISARHDSAAFAWGLFTENPLLGGGVGVRKEFDSTNLALSTLAETGIVGGLAFLLIHVAVIQLTRRGVRLIRQDDPRYSLIVLGGALVLARFTHGMVDHYWSRGMLLVAWTMVGLATMAIVSAAAEARATEQETDQAAQQEQDQAAPETEA